MGIKLTKGKPANKEAVFALESFVGCRLSGSYRSFLETNDGAEPESNIFRVDEKNEEEISDFIPVAEVLKERSYLRGISKMTYPVARAEGGNYVLIDEGKGGAVFFWDHELHQPLTKLADSFEGFLNLLGPFDPSTITLKPGQVKRVWTHPDFEKLVKKYEK